MVIMARTAPAGNEDIVEAICGSPDRPLVIGETSIPCYVLADERRVLSQGGVIGGLGMSKGSSFGVSGDRLMKFTNTQSIRSYVSPDLAKALREPILFLTPSRTKAYGYEATVLTDICEAVLSARDHGDLHFQQRHIADQCETLIRAFARVGIIALVDEATGYQDVRDRQALYKILQRYLHDERGVWAKRFPDEFYQEMFRLKGWQYSHLSVKRPSVVGILTNDIVYWRLAPYVLKKLRELVPRDPDGRLRWHFHQHLTEEHGLPELDKHLHAVIALMKSSTSWDRFHRSLERAFPAQNKTLLLAYELPEEREDDE